MLNVITGAARDVPLKKPEYKSPSDDTASKAFSFKARLAQLLKGRSRETMTITPEMAEAMLETNQGNRCLSKVTVDRYASDMTRGVWMVTGEPIIFSDAGVLNDGQHRLAACIKSGVPFKTDVRFGIERGAFRNTNIGKKRMLSDVLGIDGKTNCTKLAGALNWLYRYNAGLPGNISKMLSTTAGLELLACHPGIERSVDYGSRISHDPKMMHPSLAIFLHYVFAGKDKKMADEFFECVITGLGVTGAKDPRHVLRERLVSNATSKAKLPDTYIAAIAIKAWNLLRCGKTVTYLRWQNVADDKKGVAAESFPVVQ